MDVLAAVAHFASVTPDARERALVLMTTNEDATPRAREDATPRAREERREVVDLTNEEDDETIEDTAYQVVIDLTTADDDEEEEEDPRVFAARQRRRAERDEWHKIVRKRL